MKVKSFRKEYRFLSNFAPAEVEYNGIKFPSVEHAYVAAKTDNEDIQLELLKLTASEAKKYGREKCLIRADFEKEKVDIMRNLLEQKFKNEYYRYLLYSTEDSELIEGNTWHDNYFGSCTCDYCEDKGQNVLGKLLMIIRSQIKENKFDVVSGMEQIEKIEN